MERSVPQKCLYYPFMLNIITEHSGVLFKGLKVTFTVGPEVVGFPQLGLGQGDCQGTPSPAAFGHAAVFLKSGPGFPLFQL